MNCPSIARASCLSCTQRPRCLTKDMDETNVELLEGILRRPIQLAAGEHLFWQAEQVDHVYVVRSGCVKTYSTDTQGDERVRGFYFPGDMVGLDAMHRDQYASSAQALAATEMCAIPNQALRAVADHAPVLNRRLFELMGRELSTALDLAGDYTAEQRVAAFLLQMDQHANEHGELRLEMSRRDIANWLRLVTETVSRVLTRFRDDGIISVSRRSVIFHDLDRLRSLAGPLAQSNAVHSRQSDMLLQHAA